MFEWRESEIPGESSTQRGLRQAHGVSNTAHQQYIRGERQPIELTGPIGREIRPCDEQCKSFVSKPRKWLGLSVLTGVATGTIITRLVKTYNDTDTELDEDKRQESIDVLTKLLLATGSMFVASVTGFAVTCCRQRRGRSNENDDVSAEEGQSSIPLRDVRVESVAQSQGQVQSV